MPSRIQPRFGPATGILFQVPISDCSKPWDQSDAVKHGIFSVKTVKKHGWKVVEFVHLFGFCCCCACFGGWREEFSGTLQYICKWQLPKAFRWNIKEADRLASKWSTFLRRFNVWNLNFETSNITGFFHATRCDGFEDWCKKAHSVLPTKMLGKGETFLLVYEGWHVSSTVFAQNPEATYNATLHRWTLACFDLVAW